jgi:hypothetical protein
VCVTRAETVTIVTLRFGLGLGMFTVLQFQVWPSEIVCMIGSSLILGALSPLIVLNFYNYGYDVIDTVLLHHRQGQILVSRPVTLPLVA